MKQTGKKILAAALALTMLAGTMAGCNTTPSSSKGNDSKTESGSGTQTPSGETTNLLMLLAGEEPTAQDKVLDKLAEMSKESGINVKLDVQYTPWSDYMEKVKMMAAGNNDFDLYLDFFQNLAGAVNRKQALPLNDLLDQHGQDIKKVITDDEFAGVSVDGKIYGIPAQYPRFELGSTIMYREDLRKKYNLPELTDLASYEAYLDAIKENEPNMVPMCITKGIFQNQIIRAVTDGEVPYQFGPGALWPFYVDVYNEDYTVQNGFKTQWFKDTMAWGKKAYDNGWFEKDILSQQDSQTMFKSNKAASIDCDAFQLPNIIPAVQAVVPEAEVQLLIFNKDGEFLKNMPSNNICCFNQNSKNPEVAMKFVNWIFSDQKAYDTFMYGIEGDDFTYDEDIIKIPDGVDPATRPYNPTPWIFYQESMHKFLSTDPQEYVDAFHFYRDSKKHENPLMAFQFDATKVKTQYAQIETVVLEKGYPVMCGMKSTDADYQEFLDALDANGMEDVMKEAQTQIDAFLAAQK